MGINKGHTNNPNGRPKGVPNKDNKEIKEKIKLLLEDYSIEQMQKDFKKLTPIERLKTFSGLVEYIYPKIQRINAEVHSKENVPHQIYILPDGTQLDFSVSG